MKQNLDQRLHMMLSAHDKKALGRAAEKKGVSDAEIVRRALRAYLKREKVWES